MIFRVGGEEKEKNVYAKSANVSQQQMTYFKYHYCWHCGLCIDGIFLQPI